ncbi:uncharacterized protein METZ01_LOCUS298180 [marine metagenome]|uniref:Uncharacterized protein n=1 Tax=marine metagenome TaxID=408172 RepID=A0A382M906_9ZZZZ
MELSKKTKAALWWHRLKTKSNLGVDALSLSNEGQTPRRFMIILPEHTTESDLAKRFIYSMRNALGPSGVDQMRILGPAVVGNLMNLGDFHDFILYSETDLNRWGLPGKELMWTCQRIQVDAVLDLNQVFAPVSATLCEKISAPLKVGFYSEEGEGYFNIMVRRQGEELAESGFKEIFQILGIR